LDKFTHVKTYHKFDDEISHLEGGIPILDQSLESPFQAPSPPHEEVHLNDVIERIKRLILDENLAPSQSAEQPRPSLKGPPK
jgi:hypothetical protein